MHRELKITDDGKDYGFNRFNARSGYELISSTNKLQDLIKDVEEFFSDPEPDLEALLEERTRPGAREEAMMEHGITLREGRL